MKGDDPATASGLLKRELERLGGLLHRMRTLHPAVPAGAALAVDRDRFSALVTRSVLEAHPLIEGRSQTRPRRSRPRAPSSSPPVR